MRRTLLSLSSAIFIATATLAAAQAPEPAREQSQTRSPYSAAEVAAWAKESESKTEYARQFPDAWSLYSDLKQKAHGGTKQTSTTLPDWSGLWTRDYRPGRRKLDAFQDLDDDAKLTPEYFKEWKQRQAEATKGNMFDPLSSCQPTGFPRWLASPFLREQIVTPSQTLLIAEQVNEVRRVYTDGRGHIPEADRYPLWLGDSVGFWDGPRLVIHTNQLRNGIFARNSPQHSDQVEVVEVMQRTSARNIDVDVWVYDKQALLEPWFVKVRYAQVPNDDLFLRIRHWECTENPNNAVIQTESGASDYRELNFGNSNKTSDSKKKDAGTQKK